MNFLYNRPERLPAVVPTQDEWLSYRSKHDDISSRVCISKDFLKESKTNSRKLHFNKKNPTRHSRYYKDLQSKTRNNTALVDSNNTDDHIFQTSLPNAVDLD